MLSAREQFGLSQQAFASLLGVSFVSVNRWEQGHAIPRGLSAVLLELLDDALAVADPELVLASLRSSHTDVARVRALVSFSTEAPGAR